jgi:ABC-type branched-subunit amino acid transport system substrate-binding protein
MRFSQARRSSYRRSAVAFGVFTAMVGAAAIGPSAQAATSSSSGRTAIPTSAFKSSPGLTASTVTVANVSTESLGLFTGSVVGTKAYAAYVNSQGGVNGRKVVVNAQDDLFTGAENKQLTEIAVRNDFAMVGSFSLEDSFAESVIAQNPGFPDVSTTLDPALAQLPNSYSANPTGKGWATGAIDYFGRKYPKQVKHTGVLASTYASALATWKKEKPVLQRAGYTVSYFATVPVTQTDFTPNVVAMRNAGIQLILIDQLPQNYAGALLKALSQQNFHPTLVIGTAAYSNELVASAGGPAAADGSNLEMPNALFLGGDEAAIPADVTFLKWVQQVSPGFKPDYYTLAGWTNAQLFVQALKAAGKNPTRGSVQQQLRKITSFSGSGLIAPSNPAAGLPGHCYLIAKIVNGQFVRSDDPPVNGPFRGYRCDGGYLVAH